LGATGKFAGQFGGSNPSSDNDTWPPGVSTWKPLVSTGRVVVVGDDDFALLEQPAPIAATNPAMTTNRAVV
jgi:hypothetical protein